MGPFSLPLLAGPSGVLILSGRKRSLCIDEVDDFFPALIVSEAGRQWETSLADLVRPLPAFDDVIAGLRASVRTLLGQR